MPLFTEIEIENFRRLKHTKVRGLTRVNIVTGDNNSGKTSLLEAVEFLAADASPQRLWQGLERRGARLELEGEDRVLDVSELFHGRLAERIDEDHPGAIVSVRGVRGSGKARVARAQVLASHIRGPHLECQTDEDYQPTVPLIAGRGIALSGRNEVRASAALSDPTNVWMVPPGTPTAALIGEVWRQIAATEIMETVRESLQLIDSNVIDLAVTGEGVESTYGGIFLRLRGISGRVSLAGFGDGSKRLAALGCALGASHGGVLLVDELTEGIHHSRHEALLRLLVEASRRIEVQIFSTTHSKDCIEAVASLHSRDPQTGAEISVHRLDPEAEQTYDADSEKVEFLLQGEQELR